MVNAGSVLSVSISLCFCCLVLCKAEKKVAPKSDKEDAESKYQMLENGMHKEGHYYTYYRTDKELIAVCRDSAKGVISVCSKCSQ